LHRLRYSRAVTARTWGLIEATGDALQGVPDASLVRHLAARVGADDLDRVVRLATAVAQRTGEGDPVAIDGLAQVVAQVRSSEDLADLDGPLSGRDVIDLLGLAPGPQVGAALAHLRACRLDRGPLTASEAGTELQRWWAESGAAGSPGAD
jgi:poly(A) polymerase